MKKKFDPERHISAAEIANIRGPFVQRPKDIEPREWLRWAQEVVDAEPLARQILEAQARKAASPNAVRSTATG